MMNRASRAVLAAALLAVLATAPALYAQDFRMESDVFSGAAKEPLVQTLTLFQGGNVYDFLMPGMEEIIVFESDRGRFVLLDSTRRVKTVITTEQILQYTAAMKSREAESKPEHLLEPQLETAFDEESGWLTLSSPKLVYRAKGMQPQQHLAVYRYQNFADWYARLNSLHPANLPPFPRLELNKALADRSLIPEEVERTLIVGTRLAPKKFEVRSRHMVNWQLSNTDVNRIQLAGRHMAEFEAISFQEYRQKGQ